MSLATLGCVQKLQTASHETSCVFSESRMREICLSGSRSGNRKQSEPNRDWGGSCESTPTATGRLKPLRLFSSLLPISNNVGGVKHNVRTRLRALVEERHFALVGGLRFPTLGSLLIVGG